MNRFALFLLAALGLLGFQAQAEAACNNQIPESTPTSAFTLYANGTAVHHKTGLMWMRCALGQTWTGSTCTGTVTKHTWQQALQQGANATFAGYGDWRLPNIKELPSITERRCYNPAINVTVFPNTPPSPYFYSWSSSVAGYPGNAWHLDFGYGSNGYGSKGVARYVRLVRGGQSFADFDSQNPSVPGAVTVEVTSVTPPAGYPPLNPADAVSLTWTTTGANPGDPMILSLKRDHPDATSLPEPDNLNWYEFTAHAPYGGSTPNDGNAIVTIPPNLKAANDWTFCVRHVFTDAYDCSERFTYSSAIITPIRIVYSPGLWVRNGPGTQEPIITEVSGNQAFVAFDKAVDGEDRWYKIHLPCGNTSVCSGWVQGAIQGTDYAVEAPDELQLEVANHTLSIAIRALPNGSVLDSAQRGQRFVTFEQSAAGSGCSSPWYRIHLPRSSYAESGWVCGDVVNLVGSAEGPVLALQGKVSRYGGPLAGVTMNLTGAVSASAASDADGAYRFTDLSSGAYTITPTLPDHVFEPPTRTVGLAGASRSDLDFRACDTTQDLIGVVYDADANNARMAGVTVSVDAAPMAVTDADGLFRIAGLACGDHQIAVDHGDYEPYARTLDTFDNGAYLIFLRKPQYGMDPYGGFANDPVNTATGNYVYQRRDLEIPGIGLPFRFDLAYNSREASKTGAAGLPLGYGWTHSYHVRLTVSSGVVTITWGDGHTETYTPDGAGGYTPQYGVFDTLTDNGGGAFTLTKRDRTAYPFDASGRLAAIVDKNGNTLSLTYTGANLTQITDTAGRAITLDYDPSGRLTQITDPIGRTVQYAYDANGDLVSATDPKGNLTQYTYDGDHQILTVVDPRGNAVVTNTYDGTNRVVTYQTDAKGNGTTFSYQELDRVTTITDALGNVTIHHHDALLRLTKEEDGRGGIALYEYDTLGNRVKVTDKNGNVTRYAYDARGNVTRITDALSQVTTITYDANDNPLTRTDALGNRTQYAYDANGNLTQTTDALGNVSAMTYDARGLPLTVTDPRGHVTTNAYDPEGNLTQVTNPLGNLTAYGYDGVGRRLTETDALGRITRYAYDANDNLLTLTDALGGGVTHTYDGNDNKTSTTDPNGHISQWAYDQKDLLIGKTDALSNAETYTYDALDRRLSRTDRRGFTTQYAYDAVGKLVRMTEPLGNVTTYSYDLNGNRLSQTNARGHTTTFTYDALNHQTKVKDALGHEVVTAYDALGRVATVTAPGGRVTQNTYDALGRLTQTKDPENGIIQSSYDANGNRVSQTDPRGNTTGYAYDALNRLVQITDALGHSIQTAYDAVGNRASVTDALGHTTGYAYDALNRPVTQTDALGHTSTTAYDAGGRVTATTDANGRTTAFAYDALDRLTQVTDAAGGAVRYTYDANGNRLSMTDPNGNVTQYAYDALNRRTAVTEPLGNVTSLVYDAGGNPIQKTDPKGQVTHYAYDALNRRTGIDYPAQPDVAFTYDAVGNLLTLTDGLGATTHAYDRLDRRTSTTDPFGQIVGYGYDGNGNRTSLTYPGGKTVTYAYDAANRMTRVIDWLGHITTYSYDAADRLTGAVNANGTTTAYGYDAADRLTGLTNAKSNATVINAYSYTLDPVGNHQSEARTEPLAPVLPAATVNDTHDAENRLTASNGVANTFDANGNLIAKGADTYAYDAADRLIQISIGGTPTQYQYDGLGNRYGRSRGGVETRFVLDTNTALTNVLMETDGTGNPLVYNVFGQGLIARIQPDDSVLQYHYDSRGSTIALTDGAQTAIQQYAYDPFGKTLNITGNEANSFGFLGRYGVLDEGNDLNYIRARYYDAGQQRFLNKDVKLGEDSSTQMINRYVYAVNNPIVLIDVSGFSPKDIISQGDSDAIGIIDQFKAKYGPNWEAAYDFWYKKDIEGKSEIRALFEATLSGKANQIWSEGFIRGVEERFIPVVAKPLAYTGAVLQASPVPLAPQIGMGFSAIALGLEALPVIVNSALGEAKTEDQFNTISDMAFELIPLDLKSDKRIKFMNLSPLEIKLMFENMKSVVLREAAKLYLKSGVKATVPSARR